MDPNDQLGSIRSQPLLREPLRQGTDDRSVGLSILDEVVLSTARGSAPADLLFDDAKNLASGLAGGEDADACRIRTVSRLLALEKHRLQLLQARQGVAIEAGHLDRPAKYDRLINSATKRVTMLARAHREELRGIDPSTVVMVARAERVDAK